MYEETLKKKFYSKDISKANKDYMKFFLQRYNGTQSTINKFYSWLPYFLTQTTDVKQAMNDEKELVGIFDKLHSKLGASGYKTVFDTSKSFCKVLNNGKVPEAFNSVKKLTKKEKETMKRINQKGYKTLSWEDGLKIAEGTNSMQLKAMVLCQLDAGLRPHELAALDYGDVKKDGKFLILKLNDTKTAKPRDVVLYKSASYLNRWLQLHPTKKGSLWIIEHKDMSSKLRNGSKDMRYNYHAIKQIIRRLSKKAGFNSVSLYMIRHSAISLSKQDRMDLELGAEKFGHDINYYINTYGKLTPEQKVKRFKEHYGEETEEKKKKPINLLCPICDFINLPEKEFCEKCNSPLTLSKALEVEKGKNKEIEEMKKQLADMPRQIILQITRNPEVLKAALKMAKK